MFCQNRSRRFYNNVPYIDVLPKSIANSNDNNNVPYIDVLPKSIAEVLQQCSIYRCSAIYETKQQAQHHFWGEAPGEGPQALGRSP